MATFCAALPSRADMSRMMRAGFVTLNAKSATGLRPRDFQAAATDSRHVVIAAARSTR